MAPAQAHLKIVYLESAVQVHEELVRKAKAGYTLNHGRSEALLLSKQARLDLIRPGLFLILSAIVRLSWLSICKSVGNTPLILVVGEGQDRAIREGLYMDFRHGRRWRIPTCTAQHTPYLMRLARVHSHTPEIN